MSELNGAVGELHFTLTVTRKENGAVEQHEMVGRIIPPPEEPPVPVPEISSTKPP